MLRIKRPFTCVFGHDLRTNKILSIRNVLISVAKSVLRRRQVRNVLCALRGSADVWPRLSEVLSRQK